MTTKRIIGLIALAVLVIGGLIIYFKPTTNQTSVNLGTLNPVATTSVNETPTTKPPAIVTNGYTATEVATHNSKTNCWTSINGAVYDVTAWIGKHPGGAQAILSLCGKDGSSAFNDQHGGQRRPEKELAGFKIGNLTK